MSLGKTGLVMVNLLVFLANPALGQTIEPVWLSEHSSDPATVLEMARRRHEAYQVLFEAGAISRIQAERAAERYRTLLEQYNAEQNSDTSTLPPHSDPCDEMDAIIDDLKRMRRVFNILFPLYREGAFPRIQMEAIIVDYQEQLDRRQQLLSLNQEANLEHTCPDTPDSEPVLQQTEPVVQQTIVVTSLPRGWFTEDLSSERLFQPLTLSEPDPETNNRSGRRVCSIFTTIERCNETP